MKQLAKFFLLAFLLHAVGIFFLFPSSESPEEASFTVKAGAITVEIHEPIQPIPGKYFQKRNSLQEKQALSEPLTQTSGSSEREAKLDGDLKVEYPIISRKMGEEGETSLFLAINERGEVTEVRIEKSSGYTRLDEAAKKLMERARFTPPRVREQPIPSTKNLKIKFQLN